MTLCLFREGDKTVSVEAEPNLEDKDYKKTLKLTWLAETERASFIPCVCVYFDHIISKPVLAKDEDFKKYISHNTRVNITMLQCLDPIYKTFLPLCLFDFSS